MVRALVLLSEDLSLFPFCTPDSCVTWEKSLSLSLLPHLPVYEMGGETISFLPHFDCLVYADLKLLGAKGISYYVDVQCLAKWGPSLAFETPWHYHNKHNIL